MHKPFFILFLFVAGLASCNRTDLPKEMTLAMEDARHANYEQALVHANACVAFAPDNIDAQLLKSYCQFMVETKPERRRQALLNMLKCAHQAPERFEPWYFYGWALLENGQTRDAIEPLKNALDRIAPDNPKHREVQLLLERCYSENNLIPEALSILQSFQGQPPYSDMPELYNELGLLFLKGKDRNPNAAVYFFQRGLQRDAKGVIQLQNPANEVLLQNLAITYDLHFNNIGGAKRYYIPCMQAKSTRNDTEGIRRIQTRIAQRSSQ